MKNIKTKVGVAGAMLGAFIFGLSVIAYSNAQQTKSEEATSGQSRAPAALDTSFSDMQEDEIREIVRQYLLTNPEIIIESVNAYSARAQQQAQMQAQQTAATKLNELLDPAHGFVAGRANAKVAVIELFDYHCGFCKRALPLVRKLTENDKDVKVVFRELPILREESNYAAAVSLAARDQGKFLDLHYAMMEASGVLSKERVHSIAKNAGINLNKLEKSLESEEIDVAIKKTYNIAAEIGVDGTPTFIIAAIDGSYIEVVNGFRPDEIEQKISEAKKAAS